jgi:hypothetical protein
MDVGFGTGSASVRVSVQNDGMAYVLVNEDDNEAATNPIPLEDMISNLESMVDSLQAEAARRATK